MREERGIEGNIGGGEGGRKENTNTSRNTSKAQAARETPGSSRNNNLHPCFNEFLKLQRVTCVPRMQEAHLRAIATQTAEHDRGPD